MVSSQQIARKETAMAILSTDDKHIKDLLKQALVELFEERRDLFSDIIAEAIEDAGLVNAIKEGQAGYTVSKKQVLEILEE
jgi:hypothetical protein